MEEQGINQWEHLLGRGASADRQVWLQSLFGGKAPRQGIGKLSLTTKVFIKKRQHMKEANSKSEIEFTELTKLINKKDADIRSYEIKVIEAGVNEGISIITA